MTARTIRWNEALLAQLLLLQRMGRVRILVWAGVLALVVAALAEWGYAASDAIANEGFPLLSMHSVIVLAGAAWGIMLWWHEPPGRRDQFLAAPMDVTAHELTRIVAGGLWLLVVLSFTTVAGLTVQTVASGRIAVLRNIAPEAWAALFSAPLLAYVLAATVSTATRRSIEMAGLGLVAFSGLYLLVLRMIWLRTEADVMALFEINRYSLFNALGGLGTTTTTNYTEVTATSRVSHTSVVTGSHMAPYWLDATLLWWAIALGALSFVLWRRRRA
jgi:hypothetical protein